MDFSILFLLLYQVIVSLLNWYLVLVQRGHLAGGFMGTFCISFALVDTLFATAAMAIYSLQDFMLLGVRFTRYHVCLLAQIMGCIYNTLQWPVVFTAALDHYLSPLLPAPPAAGQERVSKGRARRLSYVACACMLWVFSVLYVFLQADGLHPAFFDTPVILLDCCLTLSTPRPSQIGASLLGAMVGIKLYTKIAERGGHTDVFCVEEGDGSRRMPHRLGCEHSRVGILGQTLTTFAKTWAAFLLLMIVVLVLRADVPSHLAMNVPWLCFLNSFMISVCLPIHYQYFKANKISKLTDGFCQWELTFAEGGTTKQMLFFQAESKSGFLS